MIKLSAPLAEGDEPFRSILLKRRSRRHFSDTPLAEAAISTILWAAYGYKVPGPGQTQGRGDRTCPSAGALYPLRLYLVAGNIKGINTGYYRYIPEKHSLGLIHHDDLREELCEACLQQEMILRAPAVLLYTIQYDRVTARYGERGRLRYVSMDIGHSAQNVYLQAEALGLGTCAVGAFSDAAVKSTACQSDSEEPLYLMPIGVPAGST